MAGKARAWRVLGMMPGLRKSATLAQSDKWRKERRLRLHHASIAHVVDMVNRFCGEDKHVLCADGQVSIHVCSMYILCIYMYIQSVYIYKPGDHMYIHGFNMSIHSISYVYTCLYFVHTCIY